MVDMLKRPTDQVQVFFFTEQPNGYVRGEDLEKYPNTRMEFPNTYFSPEKAVVNEKVSTSPRNRSLVL